MFEIEHAAISIIADDLMTLTLKSKINGKLFERFSLK